MAAKFFPLRWESTADQWWFASPIDWAAANGHYDLVRELLHIDANLLVKLTSLPRIRRLETVWDDDDLDKFNDVAKCRASVARKLLHDSETSKGYNSLIRGGYGGWLLYTAAAAGDLIFVKELLDRDGLLVFGEGEYGIVDIFYAAARSKSREVFRLLFDCAVAPNGRREEAPSIFRWEVMNRAVHAAARGGCAAALVEFLGDGSDVLTFRDAQGSTVLHTAAGRGQVQIVKKLISSYDIINSVDDRGNTALNVAAYRGHLAVMRILISASPSSALSTNNYGDTFLHMAIAGFRSPTFRRLDRQIELMKEIVGGNLVKIDDIINIQNNDGRTPLHIAIVENVQSEVVEMLLSIRCIDLNIKDGGGNTPLDLLNQRPRSATCKILIKKLVSAGGVVSSCQDPILRNAHLRIHGIGGSPGTSFRIADSEMVFYTGLDDTCRSSCEFDYSGEIGASPAETPRSNFRKSSSMTNATSRLKILLRWPRFDREPSKRSSIPLRQQFSRQEFLPSNKRILSLQGNLPSPTSKKKLGSSLTLNPRQVLPKSNLGSPCSAFSESSWSSPLYVDKKFDSGGPSSLNQSPIVEKVKMKRRHGSFNLGLMNDYFCFGGQGIVVENSIRERERD